MKPTTLRRHRFRRAVERGDPRLGLFAGAAAALLAAALFAAPDRIGVVDRLELAALDLAFRHRPPIPESPELTAVDMDDNTFKKVSWPLDRKHHARAIWALDRLGARRIVMDVQFKMVVPEEGDYDPQTGEPRLNPSDRFLRASIGASGKVLLAYHLELEDPIGDLRPHFDRIKAVFAKRIGATRAEAARETGIPEALLEASFEACREEAVVSLVAERRSRPPATFEHLKREFLPDFRPGADRADLHLLAYAYWVSKARDVMAEKAARITLRRGSTSELPRAETLVPVSYPFLERALGVGCANAEPDLDGVMRRPWAAVLEGSRAHPYLGLAATGEAMDLADGRLAIGNATLPLDREGRLLVNWAGNRSRRRAETFAHVPYLELLRLFRERYEVLDGNMRRQIEALEERGETEREYLSLSDRLAAVFRGEAEAPPEELRRAEARLDEIRRSYADALRRRIAEDEAALARISSPRIRDDARRRLGVQQANLESLTSIDAQEGLLRPLIDGRICVVGSASTASGDLHASPLRAATPGMDVQLNVANMALTGRAIRRLPSWASFAGLLALGLLVSTAVAHLGTAWSAGVAGLAAAGSVGAFYGLLSAASFLVPGAGPLAVVAVTFGTVTAFKELVTQRSKRRLQRELERNTSPELVKILLEHPEYLSEPRKMQGTFFFSDVKSFTSISERMKAEVLFPFINRYLDRMTRVLKSRQAYLDKYIGDGIMALFGVPVSSPDHARNACLAALECQETLSILNRELALEGLPELKTRIGLNSGEVSAGYVGASERSEYSVLGDPVNLAARLEGANKEYGTSIMVSESTRDLAGPGFVTRELDRIRVVGKREPTAVYELVGRADGPLPMSQAFLDAYNRALVLYRDRRWSDAVDAFRTALSIRSDKAADVYLERSRAFLSSPPPADWDGVFELESK